QAVQREPEPFRGEAKHLLPVEASGHDAKVVGVETRDTALECDTIAVGAWIRSRIAGGGKLRDCRVLNRKGGPASAHRRCGCDRATIRHEVVVKAYPSPVGGRLRASPRSVAVLKCHPQRREAVAERDVERRQGLAGWCVGIAW